MCILSIHALTYDANEEYQYQMNSVGLWMTLRYFILGMPNSLCHMTLSMLYVVSCYILYHTEVKKEDVNL